MLATYIGAIGNVQRPGSELQWRPSSHNTEKKGPKPDFV